MESQNNAHYIRLDDQNRIIDGWSDGPFPCRSKTDAVLLTDEGGYQFRLFPGGGENPALTEENGVPLYRWDGARAVPRTAEEIAADIAALPRPEPAATAEQEQIAALMLRQARQEAEQQRFNADILLAVAQARTGGGMDA